MPNRKRKSRRVWRPLCPVHGGPMLVKCVRKQVQYRYCPVPGCRESTRTFRELPPRKPVCPVTNQTCLLAAGAVPVTEPAGRRTCSSRQRSQKG